MKRTLLVTIDFPPMVGGVSNYWANLCRELPQDDLVVLAPEFDGSIDFDIQQNYLIYRKELISKLKWFWPKWLPLFFSVLKIVKQEKIQRIIVGHLLPTGTVALILKKILRIPYVVSVHGLDVAYTQASHRKKHLAKKIVDNAERVISNSVFTKKLLQQYGLCDEDKVELVYPCANIKSTNVPEKIRDNLIKGNNLLGKKVILTVGRLIERKGQDKILEALPQVLLSCPDAFYISVGHGPKKESLIEIAEKLGVSDNVCFYYDVMDYELPAFYTLADVFVMPCRELDDGDIEGFGIVFLEAGMFCKPVIAGRSGGAVEAVEHGNNGLLVDPININEIAQAIITLLKNKGKADLLGSQGYKRVQEQFNWSEQAKKIISIINL